MFIENINNKLKKTTAYELLLFLILPFLFASCSRQTNSIEEQKVQDFFRKTDSAFNTPEYKIYPQSYKRKIDSAYNTLSYPSRKSAAERNIRLVRYFGIKLQYDSIRLYLDSNLLLLQDNVDDPQLLPLYVVTLLRNGNWYFNKKKYNEAIRNYTQSKLLMNSQAKPDSLLLYDYYNSMANALYAQKKYLLAADFFRAKYIMSYLWHPHYSECSIKQENLSNTGVCYFYAGMPDSAMSYYSTALDYINKSEPEFPPSTNTHNSFESMRAVVLDNQADVLYQQKKYSQAAKLYEASAEKTAMLDSSFIRPLKLTMANLYLDIGQPQKAIPILDSLLTEISLNEVSNAAVKLNKLVSSYYILRGEPQKANVFFERALALRDSLEKRDRDFNTTDMQKEVEREEQKMHNESLKKDIQIQTGYLLTIIISLCLAIIVAIMIYRNFVQKSKSVKQLILLNNSIDEKNKHLQKTLRELEQSHTENSRIIHMMAHDLKTPIKNIRTLTATLIKKCVSKNQSQNKREALELIKTTCSDSVTLIDDLLNKKRKLAEVRKEFVNMGRLIEQCSELFRVKASEKKQQLLLDIDYPLILIDRQSIWRVISNIVNNAIKFSPEEGEILIKLERKNNGVVLSVRDHGIGIPTQLKEKIFTHDPEISRTGTAGEESYGLGLAISKKIVEEHDGRLWFESKTGEGSVFFVELP